MTLQVHCSLHAQDGVVLILCPDQAQQQIHNLGGVRLESFIVAHRQTMKDFQHAVAKSLWMYI